MSTPRRALGTGPASTTPTTTEPPAPRLLPIERAAVDEDQDHDDPRPRQTPGRRKLGDRTQ